MLMTDINRCPLRSGAENLRKEVVKDMAIFYLVSLFGREREDRG
jgi:hypothetical protein